MTPASAEISKPGLDVAAVLAAVLSVLPKDRKNYALHEPSFTGKEWEYVKNCIDTGWVSSVGKYVTELENKLAEYTGLPYCVAVVNGTAALHLSLKIIGVQAGDEVLVPDLTFVATANAVAYCGAVPHFVDCSEKTLGVDHVKLKKGLLEIIEKKNGEVFNKKTGRRIKALIVMHAFGHPAELDELSMICEALGIELIEDAAESLGSFYKKKHTGAWGTLSTLSFNGNKIVTTGGGGAILTQDRSLAEKAKHLSTTAKVPHAWQIEHDETAFNYRMPNLNAALGLAQLENLSSFVQKKRDLAAAYARAFAQIKGVRFFTEPEHAESNYWLNTLILDPEFRESRHALISLLHENAIQARPAWTLMHKLPMYQDCPKMNLETAEALEGRIINLPSSASLS